MLADVRLRMQEQSLTQSDIAERAGWPQSLVSAYLTGDKEPGIGNLAKLASAVGCKWRLTDI
jgi:transcriptional regulator with XRE-family HTH domain